MDTQPNASHKSSCEPRSSEVRGGECFGYSFALAYELISQFRQTSSKAGAVHCMIIFPQRSSLGPCECTKNIQSFAATQYRLKNNVGKLLQPSRIVATSKMFARSCIQRQIPGSKPLFHTPNQCRHFRAYPSLFTFNCTFAVRTRHHVSQDPVQHGI